MEENSFDHGIPNNPYNKHAWITGKPEIGEDVWIGAFCLIDASHSSLKIGPGTDISSGSKILTHSTVKRCVSERDFGMIETAPTEIGEFCFIGTNAVVLMGAKIGHHSIIAAGAVVPQFMVVPPYSVVVGVPARITGSSKKYLKNVDNKSINIALSAYNEEDSIEQVIKDASKAVQKITSDYELIVVDDGSNDNTGPILDKLAKENKRIKVIHHDSNRGFTGGMKTSFKNATKNLIFLAPADGQFDFSELEIFFEAIKGRDVVLGYRIINEEGIIRKVNSRLFHLLCRNLLGIKFKEISSVSLWRKRVIDSIDIEADNRSAMFLPEMVYKSIKKRWKFAEVPIHWYERKGGKAKGSNFQVIISTLTEMVKFWWQVKSSNPSNS